MKIVVTHNSPDWDAITSVWLIKRFLPGWNEAEVRFVAAGDKLRVDPPAGEAGSGELRNEIEKSEEDEVIHVDTGLGALDHHQIEDDNISAASLTLNFINQVHHAESQDMNEEKKQALDRMVKIVVDIDHFKEVFWDNPTADYHEFSFLGILEGLKLQKPNDDELFINFGMEILDAILHNFENRIWAEREIKENGKEFNTRWGKGIALETINDSVLKLAQKMGYEIVVRRDPRKGYLRIKAKPTANYSSSESGKAGESRSNDNSSRPASQQGGQARTIHDIDLTPVYEKLKKMDPEATWFLHVSKKMLLNGTTKNPKMKPTTLSLDDIIRVLETI